MTEKEKKRFDDTILQMATAMREKSQYKYPFGWDIYRNKMEKACMVEKMYMEMDLPDDQRKIIDNVLDLRSDASNCELTLTYIAGLLDGIVFLRDSGFLDMYITEEPDEDEIEKRQEYVQTQGNNKESEVSEENPEEVSEN